MSKGIGIIFIIIGFGISVLTILKKCMTKVGDYIYNSVNCVSQQSFWILLIMGIILSIVGIYMLKNSN